MRHVTVSHCYVKAAARHTGALAKRPLVDSEPAEFLADAVRQCGITQPKAARRADENGADAGRRDARRRSRLKIRDRARTADLRLLFLKLALQALHLRA